MSLQQCRALPLLAQRRVVPSAPGLLGEECCARVRHGGAVSRPGRCGVGVQHLALGVDAREAVAGPQACGWAR